MGKYKRIIDNGNCYISKEVLCHMDSMDDCINLKDSNGVDIYVNDILYCSQCDTYYTVFEVPGGYAIESNPKSFGIYDKNDLMPVYESTADPQTSSYISMNLKVIGNIHENKELYNKIKDEYKFKKNR